MDLAKEILKKLDSLEEIDDTALVFPGISPVVLQGALNSLKARSMIEYKQLEHEEWLLTKEGQEIEECGKSHEFAVYKAVCESLNGLKISDLSETLKKNGSSSPNTSKVGQSTAFKLGWIKKDGDKLVKKISNDEKDPIDKTLISLKEIKKNKTLSDEKEINELKKRKLISRVKILSFSVKKGKEFSLEIPDLQTDITADMITSGSWRNSKFKDYNFNAEGSQILAGALHPLNKVREEFRQIFFSMGFTEMPTGQYVESGFWNFDSLYVPQQHPARDLQDTFYIKDPSVADMPKDKKYWENVKNAHEGGYYGSIGYRYDWHEVEAKKLVLRTHTTAVSSKMLKKLAEDGVHPARYFSIDRVFRNEAVDATHLAEFHQVEGVIADYDLTLGDLIGFMNQFFRKMGMEKLRFKPTYNPYTEPSMEIYGWHEGLQKWVEIGNSGMFRPEMLEPMGLPPNLRVHGWGLSLERPTMIKYGVKNIRELLGHKVSLDFIESNPAVRLDLNDE